MRVRLIVGGIWFATVVVTVLTAFVTRSTLADVNGLGGAFIVGSCAFVVAVTAGLVRSSLILAVTAVVAAMIGSMIAWNVLHDQSSTAALGVIAPAIVRGLLALLGIGMDVLARRKSTPWSKAASTP